jgi:hypothetical protein
MIHGCLYHRIDLFRLGNIHGNRQGLPPLHVNVTGDVLEPFYSACCQNNFTAFAREGFCSRRAES